MHRILKHINDNSETNYVTIYYWYGANDYQISPSVRISGYFLCDTRKNGFQSSATKETPFMTDIIRLYYEVFWLAFGKTIDWMEREQIHAKCKLVKMVDRTIEPKKEGGCQQTFLLAPVTTDALEKSQKASINQHKSGSTASGVECTTWNIAKQYS